MNRPFPIVMRVANVGLDATGGGKESGMLSAGGIAGIAEVGAATTVDVGAAALKHPTNAQRMIAAEKRRSVLSTVEARTM